MEELSESYVIYSFQIFQLDTTAKTHRSSLNETYAKYLLCIFRMHDLKSFVLTNLKIVGRLIFVGTYLNNG